jgi:ligand-binding sensor domain-containing protein/two-component sensor histidine kinase
MTKSSSIRIFILWKLLLCAWPNLIFSQVPNIQFEKLNTQDGLPSNSVMFATKDQKGFMWFGTRRCPTRFDGNSFRNFLDIETIFVTGIAADNQNNIWLATDQNGICMIDNTTQKMEVVVKNPKAPQTGNFFIDSFGKGWFSDWFGVYQIDLETREVKNYPFRQTTYVWIKASFIEDNEKNLWVIGTDNGLFKYDRENDKLVGVLGNDAEKEDKKIPIVFSKATLDSNGILWIGTHNFGLVRFDPKSETFQQFLSEDQRKIILSVAMGTDESGKPVIWFGDTEGLGVFRPEQGKFYRFKNIFPNAFRVDHIFMDKADDILWVSTSEGILKYNPKNNLFKTVYIPEGTVRFPVTVNRFLQDKTDPLGNTFWLGLSHSGILKWNRLENSFQLVKLPHPEALADIRWMHQIENGNIWIGSNQWSYQRPGIWEFDPRTSRFIQSPLSQLANKYFSVPFFMYGFFDHEERLWIGNSDEGIRILDKSSSRDVTFWDSLAQAETLIKGNNLINDMILDKNGKVWLATYKGVYFIDPESKEFINADSISPINDIIDPAVNTLHEDREGNIWAARWGSVTKSRPDGSIELNLRYGLADRENKGVVQDGKGNIWIGNFEGLHYFNPKTGNLLRFTINEGLSSNNTLNRLAIIGGKELLIGQKNGFNVLDIGKLDRNEKPRKIEIASFKIHDKPYTIIDYDLPIILKRKDNSFSVDFTSLNYSKKQDNQYAYFLEGFDQDWINNGPNHLVNYTNLDPKNYVLHLKTGTTLGEWNSLPFQLEIRILPAFYETWWFRIGILILFVLMFYTFYRYRINQILHMQKVRDAISSDLHDEIGSSLSNISLMGTIAKSNLNDSHPTSTFLEKIVQESRMISNALDDIVWSINPQNDELSKLVARMVRYCSDIFEAKGIAYELDVKDKFENLKLSMEGRRDFYLIFKEAVNNLVKYSDCTKAKIQIHPDQGRIWMMISDNGKGFDQNNIHDRNGIKNMKKRSLKLKGKISIDSKPGQGTSIKLDFPL